MYVGREQNIAEYIFVVEGVKRKVAGEEGRLNNCLERIVSLLIASCGVSINFFSEISITH